jgi:hypothetical protein
MEITEEVVCQASSCSMIVLHRSQTLLLEKALLHQQTSDPPFFHGKPVEDKQQQVKLGGV